MPNPYEVSADIRDAADRADTRPLWCTAITALQIVGCAGYVAVGIFLAVLTSFVGFGTARTDERLLTMAVIVTVPVAAWLFVIEMINWREVRPKRERLLARFGVVLAGLPFVMAAFWFYEFTLAGSFQLNGLPAIFSATVGVVWLVLAQVRLKRAAYLVRSEAADGVARSA